MKHKESKQTWLWQFWCLWEQQPLLIRCIYISGQNSSPAECSELWKIVHNHFKECIPNGINNAYAEQSCMATLFSFFFLDWCCFFWKIISSVTQTNKVLICYPTIGQSEHGQIPHRINFLLFTNILVLK